MSAPIRIGRRRRSAQTPASKPTSRKGAVSAAPRMPIWTGSAWRVSAAVNGSATSAIPIAEDGD